MKTKLLLFISTVLLLGFSVLPAGAVTLVNFDDKATGTAVLWDDYVSLGVASITETEGLGFFGRYASSQSQPNYIGTGLGGERGTDALLGWDGTILIELTNAANMVGIGIADSRGGPEILSIYDSSYNLLDSMTAPIGINTYGSFARSSYDIKYFSIRGDFFAVDDLEFNSASVPEPSTLLLLGSGLLGFGFFARKRIKG